MSEADQQRLLEKYKGADSDDPHAPVELQRKLLEYVPVWTKHPQTKPNATSLSGLNLGAKISENKLLFQRDIAIVGACMEAMSVKDDPMLLQYLLTLLYNMLREDSSCYNFYAEALGNNVHKIQVFGPLVSLLEQTSDSYIADKAAWLLTAIMGNVPGSFSASDVDQAMTLVLQKETNGSCTQLGALEAITNVLKADTFRKNVWNHPGVPDDIFSVGPSASSPVLYRAVFALWTLSFDKEITASLQKYAVVPKLKGILMSSRVEKVVRLGLTVLKNFLGSKILSESIVEEGLLDVVQQLEYEKWRDTELYDDIREVANLIASEVKELSNFDRYERELDSGKLSWGFIHSPKFWAENGMKFENNEFKALKTLAELLASSQDPMTLAVACHDIGEFVTMHASLGKKKVVQLGVKERVMDLMTSSTEPAYREVRREALLCCQKIMLNKWQDLQEKGK